jgi:hypothetical protein
MAGVPERIKPRRTGGLDVGGNWTPEFPGQRPPFGVGNDAAVKHAAYAAPVKFGSRPQEVADAVRPYVVGFHPGMESVLQSYGLVLCRVERAARALEEADEGGRVAVYAGREDPHLLGLQTHLRHWLRLSVAMASELGLTPSASARILRDAGIAAQAAAAHAELLERYRPGGRRS